MLGFHPANLALRFVLELSALAALAVGGYNLASGALAWMLAVGVPVIALLAWGAFNVPGDRSRSGRAPIPVSGPIRLGFELLFFAVAVALLWPVTPVPAAILGTAVLVHYALSVDRIRWLLAN